MPNKSHVWMQRVEGDNYGGGRDQRLVGMGQLILSMGLLWREICILAQRATAPSKDFS
jgi:hypothetical protein